MIQLVINGFKNKWEAEAFVNWYSNAGEQDILYSLEEENMLHEDIVESMNCDTIKTFPLKWKGDTLTMQLEIEYSPIKGVEYDVSNI
jgi:hypothetical protein